MYISLDLIIKEWFKKSTANESFLNRVQSSEFNQISINPKTTFNSALDGHVCPMWSCMELLRVNNLFRSSTIPFTTFSSKADNILFQLTRICLLSSMAFQYFFVILTNNLVGKQLKNLPIQFQSVRRREKAVLLAQVQRIDCQIRFGCRMISCEQADDKNY